MGIFMYENSSKRLWKFIALDVTIENEIKLQNTFKNLEFVMKFEVLTMDTQKCLAWLCAFHLFFFTLSFNRKNKQKAS